VISPDVKYVAAISEDGSLRVIDAMSEQWACWCNALTYLILLLDWSIAMLRTLGALARVSWSLDGRFIILSLPFYLPNIYIADGNQDRRSR
jgi:hypothetical protein